MRINKKWYLIIVTTFFSELCFAKTELPLSSGRYLVWEGNSPYVSICKNETTLCMESKMPKGIGQSISLNASPNLPNATATWIAITNLGSFICSTVQRSNRVTCAKIPQVASTQTTLQKLKISKSFQLVSTMLDGELANLRYSSVVDDRSKLSCEEQAAKDRVCSDLITALNNADAACDAAGSSQEYLGVQENCAITWSTDIDTFFNSVLNASNNFVNHVSGSPTCAEMENLAAQDAVNRCKAEVQSLVTEINEYCGQ